MSTYIKAFLETEITSFPQLMDRYIGKYYNNALYNGITWMILILHIIHFMFDISVNALLRKMRFKEYVRIRLKRSLWYLGFYGCSFLYCSATMWKNNLKLPHRHKFHMLDLTEPVSGHLLLGYALLSAFFASSSMWEGLQCSISSFTYLFLTGFVAFTYFLRYIELAILLASTFSVIHVMMELTRCLFCVIKGDLGLPKLLVRFAFYISSITFCFTYLVIIPVSFILPVGRGFLKNPDSVIMAGLNITLWGWLVCEIYASPMFRLVQHRLYHGNRESKVPECVGSLIECALFLPRDDVAYNLKIIKQEIKERQAKMMALRKPKKGTSMIVQTLKCVAAINRKLKYRKLQEKAAASTSDKIKKARSFDDRELEEEVLQCSTDFEDESFQANSSTECMTVTDKDTFTNNEQVAEVTNINTPAEEDCNMLIPWKHKTDFKGIVEEDKEGQTENEDEGKDLQNTQPNSIDLNQEKAVEKETL